ncbi:unannotated protein [freshwater metagenome]|uniref:Unannotated protein n=1 Tax=freshwater metagenome TaxID=449393 RepID=A0A6J7I0H1_9ZZZZ|nr:DUF1992 domain-containing protein [Actinomycetota bacterium]
MTDRKPRSMTVETWIERRIREAEERGAFADLPGRGRPIADLGRPRDEGWWLKRKMRAEGLSYLPPSLLLRKDVETALADARDAASEEDAREILEDINARIRAAIRSPLDGPPLNRRPVDVAAAVAAWRERRGR